MTDINMLGGHKEWAPDRKIDPTYGMPWMRNRVLDVLNQEDDMTPEQARMLNEVAAKVDALWKFFRVAKKDQPEGGLRTLISRIAGRNKQLHDHWKPGIVGKQFPGEGSKQVARIMDLAVEESAKVAGLREAVAQLADGQHDLAEIEAAAERGAAKAIEAAESDPKA